MRKSLRVMVIGQIPLTGEVVARVAELPGVSEVRQAAELPQSLAGTDVVIEMVGGVEPAYRVVMGALGQGVACVATSPMLMAAHGRVLVTAAAGQHAALGFSSAGLGMDVREVGGVDKARAMTLVFGQGGSALLERMRYRAEDFSAVEAEFLRRGEDLSDAGGKWTQARALAVLGQWCGAWPRLAGLVRTGLSAVEVEDFQKLRSFGLQLVYGARLERGTVVCGPLALAADSLVHQVAGQDVVLVEGAYGESALVQPADAAARVMRGVVADMRKILSGAKAARVVEALEVEMAEGVAAARCYVRAPYAKREALLAAAKRALGERVEGDGSWQAVLEGVDFGRVRMVAPEAVAYPVVGAWEMPEVAGLRLVG